MDGIFQAVALRAEQACLAYPLVRLFYPAVTLRGWQAYARRMARLPRHRGGLMAVTDARGYVHAVFTYRVDVDLGRGRTLRIGDLVVGRLPGRDLGRTIVTGMEALAREIDCPSILVELAPRTGESDRETLTGAGFLTETILLGRAVEPSAASAPA